MTEIRRADPVARRRLVLIVACEVVLGALLILALEYSRTIVRDPAELARRLWLVFSLLAVLLVASPIAFAVYLWSVGTRILRAGEFPPPGVRVIRDTPILSGAAAVARGRGFKALAAALAVAAAILGIFLWRVASWLGRPVA